MNLSKQNCRRAFRWARQYPFMLLVEDRNDKTHPNRVVELLGEESQFMRVPMATDQVCVLWGFETGMDRDAYMKKFKPDMHQTTILDREGLRTWLEQKGLSV